MTRTDTVWQDKTLSQTFLDDVRGAVPFAKEQIEILLQLLHAAQPNATHFLDLGCGDGILSRAILSQYPQIRGVLLDFSPTMLQSAREKLGDRASQLTFIDADFGNSNWLETIEAHSPFDIIVSGFAIHHQSDDRKQEIYREIFDLLQPGGIFLNLEHISSRSPWGEKLFEELFIDSLYQFHQQKGSQQTRDEIAKEYYHRPDKAANILAPVEVQCQWLRDVGFHRVDCYFKWLELALFGGIRPGDRSD